jgi:hypothetical protein
MGFSRLKDVGGEDQDGWLTCDLATLATPLRSHNWDVPLGEDRFMGDGNIHHFEWVPSGKLT